MTSDLRTIRVLVLYPEVMDVYADRGNLIALRARAAAHGVDLWDPLESTCRHASLSIL